MISKMDSRSILVLLSLLVSALYAPLNVAGESLFSPATPQHSKNTFYQNSDLISAPKMEAPPSDVSAIEALAIKPLAKASGVNGLSLDTSAQKTLPHKTFRLPNVHPGRDPVYAYAKTLLAKALTVTQGKYGTFDLQVSHQEAAQERQLRSLEHDMLDITWSVSSADREKQHRAVPIPIMAGLFGKRIMIIRANDNRFDEPLSLEKLKLMRAVQGYDWPDTRIFRHNKIPVLETTYKASFRIVSEGFADMFPRSVMEIQHELENQPADSELKIEPNLLISYPSPLFYFVASDQEGLANRIAEGLTILLESGEFQKILMSQPVYEESMSLMRGRTIVELNNPLLSEHSKVALSRYLTYFKLDALTGDSEPFKEN
ncbi:amino acid ABC transporter substrate-binding protein [Alteromonas sp. 1_MG-2023]|uniref:amino acid ABC transporter substrate-binding protein n=1 Tax=Alteromonas sp. 1_MG-2023 TaxID=3062669 RepID=UPI0026E3109C|nr:amino acid ABC transporter substrate-binding protein [Alteromonas sp. 1_MG-2023]MDO6568278.1 amino acid ABC transporter substrate-binding protein [Alteromonas sp. 1_MG-2023]